MKSAPSFVLPPDPFWLLKVPVKAGEQTPFHLWLLWHYQFITTKVSA